MLNYRSFLQLIAVTTHLYRSKIPPTYKCTLRQAVCQLQKMKIYILIVVWWFIRGELYRCKYREFRGQYQGWIIANHSYMRCGVWAGETTKDTP